MIGGSIQNTHCTAYGGCSDHTIITVDWSTGASTTLYQSGDPQVYTWIQAGVLEAYGVSTCGDYPGWPAVLFDHISAGDAWGRPLNPRWSAYYWSALPYTTCQQPEATIPDDGGWLLTY